MQNAATLRMAAVRRSGALVDGAWIVGGALLVAAAAQLRIPLPFTPVPITGQTFAVVLVGATLGAWRGAASLLLYLAAGAAGAPFFAGGGSGWAAVAGPTGGYLVGFIAAAWLTGRLAERGWDRRFRSALPAMLLGNLVIYLVGLPWLAAALPPAALEAMPGDGLAMKVLTAGFFPFLAGDAVKLLLAGAALPGAWKLAGRGDDPPGR